MLVNVKVTGGLNRTFFSCLSTINQNKYMKQIKRPYNMKAKKKKNI